MGCNQFLITIGIIFFMLPALQDPEFPPIGIIDFYGLRSISEQQVREALQIKEGDTLSSEPKEAKKRLESLPGVAEARIQIVCCDEGKAILFVGISEKGATSLQFRPAPTGDVRLLQDVIQGWEDFQKALLEAVRKGDSDEDQSSGHALSGNPATRAVQQRFITFAERDRKLLSDVLHHSADAEHRAIAAYVIAYFPDKHLVVNDLIEAIRDPAEGVRNHAIRALWVMAISSQRTTTHRQIQVSVRPFIEMLNSIAWGDRNKSSLALLGLTEKLEPAILSELRQKALLSLIEMARWKSSKAYEPFVLLGRVAGLSEDEIKTAWERGDRASFIESAVKKAKAK
jgi:POTRA domain, FtsQ-type